MADKTSLKPEGLAFGHTLQTAFKTVMMYSVDHPATGKSLSLLYASLNKILVQTQQFTFGFLNKRVLINDLLTDDNTLSQIEAEFFRRGIGAITFSAGITLGEFKRGLSVVATRPKVIEEKGGIQTFLQQNPLTGLRILPAVTPESEDTVLQMNPESYLMAQGILGPGGGRSGAQGLESLLRFAGLERPESFSGGARETLELAERATQASLANPAADPRESLRILVRLLEESTPSYLLSSLPQDQQAAYAGRSNEDVAQDLVEDLAVDLAAKRLSNADASRMPAVQEQVVQILTRGLQATHVAERLLQKLSRVVEDAHLPPEVFDRIRQEVMWVQLSLQQRHAHLMRVNRFDDQDFHRLLTYVHEAMNAASVKEVTEVVEHYLSFLDLPPDGQRAQEIKHVSELIPALAGGATLPLLRSMEGRLGKELLASGDMNDPAHQETAKCLVSVAHGCARFEEYGTVHKIGTDLESSLARDNARHQKCCAQGLENLLTAAAFERVIELYVAKRDDLAWAKVVGSLARWIGPRSGEVVFTLLEKESSAPNRLRLVRMCAPLLGGAAMEAARRRLADERWYVVRNACTVLGELGDPEVTPHLAVALRHPDDRVQQAAVTALIKCKGRRRAIAFAEALPQLKAQVLDTVLDELFFLKDPAGVQGLQQYVFAGTGSRTGSLEKAVRALGAIPSDSAVEVLGKVLSDANQPSLARNAALMALGRNSAPTAKRVLLEFVRLSPHDPLAAQGQRMLASAV